MTGFRRRAYGALVQLTGDSHDSKPKRQRRLSKPAGTAERQWVRTYGQANLYHYSREGGSAHMEAASAY